MISKPVEFTCDAPEADSVCVVGTFNDWRADEFPMHREANGQWKITVQIPLGHYEFKFLVGGEWGRQPESERAFHSVPNCPDSQLATLTHKLDV